jgi:nucleoid-associated protein YgaU
MAPRKAAKKSAKKSARKTAKPRMPGEDKLVKSQQDFASGLKGMLEVFGNVVPNQLVKVQPNDTLWNIATIHLGTGQRWREIFIMNLDRLTRTQESHNASPGPNTIFPGDELRVLLV